MCRSQQPTTIGSENYNIAEAQDKGFKIAVMEVLKEEISESLKEIH